ncbi:integrase [Pyrococcus yayanosii]|uniref:integrase n=1 Tax=Pyrococcus yayanosii TaxID=1008460 RepID=UPI00064F646A|nr:integrase [Pyrococcus yayanosii]
MRWPGFEPGSPARKAGDFAGLWVSLEEQFLEWLSGQVKAGKLSEETAAEYTRALKKFFDKYSPHSVEELESALTKENYKRHLCKALRKFVQFLKKQKIIDPVFAEELKESIPIKPTKESEVRISTEELLEAWEYHKRHSDEVTRLFFKILVFSGARLRTVHKMLTQFDERRLYILPNYPNIAKYALMERHGTKASLYIYMPAELVNEIKPVKIKEATIRKRLEYGRVNASTIRKWHATFLSMQGIKDHVINYIQSRVPRAILEKHYLDLELEADEAYSRVVDELKKVLEG